MAGKRVIVIGGNFGGLTGALELKHELGADVDVAVLSASDGFGFNPSLIWLPFNAIASALYFVFAMRFGKSVPGRIAAALCLVLIAANWVVMWWA